MNTGDKFGQMIYDLPNQRKNAARYMWSTFTEATQFRSTDFPESPFVIQSSGLFPISRSFDDILSNKIPIVASRYDLPGGLDYFRQEEPVACAFYLINSLHESLLHADKLDKYGRYPYHESIQYANDLIEINFVQQIFEKIFENIVGRSPDQVDSRLMYSHDIDYLFSAWKVDLLKAWYSKKFLQFPAILWKALSTRHRWNNIDEILKLEKEFNINSIFFWLTERGKSSVSDKIYIDHADYDLDKIKHLWNQVKESSSCNGLHKSAFPKSFEKELGKLPEKISINRNHFLKFTLPDHYDQIEKSGLHYDASLGFAEHYGFRNSYGRPFKPFNLLKNRPYRFTEYPLHLMDTTFLTYLNMDLEKMMEKVIGFINHHRYSCVIGLLLHNSQYNFQNEEEMKLWRRLYGSLQDMECVNVKDLKGMDQELSS